MAAQADLLGLSKNASPEAEKWAVVFDFDTDGCYPAPAVAPDGTMNSGLQDTGSRTGGCRSKEQLEHANTYTRSQSITKDGVLYTVYMYALYFPKDQAASGSSIVGHRNDWEYALVWLKAGVLTHASFSGHGGVTTKPKEELHFDPGKENTVKAVYHRDGEGTHVFRPAKPNEKAENILDCWVTPTLVEWERMQSDQVSNEDLRKKFNTYDFGNANCPVNDKNFPREIAKNPPLGYPGPDEWKQVAGQIGPVLPPGLVTRWSVLPALQYEEGRDPDRDNREVNLLKGQQAQIVIYLPEASRGTFYFNLKHDKRNADDRGRTPRITHGSLVSGDAHDWPSFGRRIYLGERGDSNHNEFVIPGGGFYVDLVLV